MKKMKKKHLAITLSKLRGFQNPKVELEQYRTPGSVAAELLWLAHSLGDIEGKTVADFGAGTGVLAAGACLLGAEKVYAVEIDRDALKIARENIGSLQLENCIELVCSDVSNFTTTVDAVIMNPPFGSQNPHADRPFLLKAFEVSNTVYSIHLAKPEVRRFIDAFSGEHGFRITHRIPVEFELPAQFFFHRKRLEKILVDIYRFENQKRKRYMFRI